MNPTSTDLPEAFTRHKHSPKLTVCVVTYNQAEVIEQCLQSLIDQAVNFEFEVLVADDCSTDGTSEIVERFSLRHPHIVIAKVHTKNIGPYENYLYAHGLARGEYVAHIDGDDYALPGKLQKQVDFLDTHPECSMVFHRCASLHKDGQIDDPETSDCADTPCDFAEFQLKYPSKSWHSSKMYRRSANLSIDRKGQKFLDKHIHFEHGRSGKVGYINSTLGVYRVGIGMSSNIYSVQELALDSYRYAIDLGYDANLIKKIIAREKFEQGLRCLQLKDFSGFRSGIEDGYRSGHRTPNSRLAYFFRCHPNIYLFSRDAIRHLRELVIR